MKRILCIFLIFSLLFPLAGCSKGIQDEVVFYYRREKFEYGIEDSVVVPEQRDVTGHKGDLSFLISLYLMGPLEEELESPFPTSTRLISVTPVVGALRIELSKLSDSFTDSQFTLACACLTLTCLELTNVQEVTITSGERSITMDRDALVLYDSITNETNNGG